MKLRFFTLCWWLLLVLFGCTDQCKSQHASEDLNSSSDLPVVTIPRLGKIRGSYLPSAAGRSFLSFRGIPYGKAPIGNLRFRDPIAAEPWDDRVVDATQEGPSCVQFDSINRIFRGVEDCLKLNVYTHDLNPVGGLRPVMVWIHGGGSNIGSGNGETDFYGPGYILDRDVVLVTFNYRLGALGYLTTEDSEAPGNYGLLDQSLALKWVRKHIGHFGGDPSSVTLFGESAGAAGVEYQILSPYSKGLFDRAIIQSGSSMWSTQQATGAGYSKLLAEDLNCPSTPSKDMVACLRTKEAEDFARFNEKIVQVLGSFPIVVFSPRVDVEREFPFLPDDPRNLFKRKQFNAVPIIIGLTEHEGTFVPGGLLANGGQFMEEFEKDPLKYIPYMMGLEMRPDRKEIAKKINEHYFDINKGYREQTRQMEQMASDYYFFKVVDESAHFHSKYSSHPVYYYNYGHRSQYTLSDQPASETHELHFDVGHADEICVMFTSNFFPLIGSPGDIKVSNILLDLWTSFASHGVPQSGLIENNWLPMSKEETRYLMIHAEDTRMINESMPFHNRLAFWDRLLGQPLARKDEL